MDSSEQGEDSFVVELLNAQARHGAGDGRLAHDADSRRDFFATSLDRETAAKDDSLAWDDGGEYARAAEDAGVDVGGMLEAGVDAKRLLDFVSNFRRREGDKLGLLDEKNLKFATSQVLREGPRAGVDVVYTQLAGGRRSRRETDAGASAHEALLAARRQPPEPRNGTSPNPEQYAPSGGRKAGPVPSARSRNGRLSSRIDGSPTPSVRPAGEDDGAETARLCDELLRWSSALEGAERQLGCKGGASGFGRRGGGVEGHGGARTRHAAKVPDDYGIEEGSERSTSTRANADHEEPPCGYDGLSTRYRDDEHEHDLGPRKEPCSPRAACGGAQNGNRRRLRQAGHAEVNGERDQSGSVEYVGGLAEAEGDWKESGQGPGSSPWRGNGRRRAPGNNNGHDRPTPSYALPTKHFKTPDRDRRYALYAEDAHRQKQRQRQAHLEEENTALKLRLEGQRRAIHELEHQANTLREDARIRQEEVSRLKKRLAASSSSGGGGKCPCCASTHPARVRGIADNGPSALKKRALAAEGRAETLERFLSESKAKEQRSREIVVSLKHSNSTAQAKVVSLEAALESTRKRLSEAKRELAECRRDAKGHMKDTRKQRRQQGEKEREAEIARAEAADLMSQLREASREIERARLEAIEMREDKARVESESKDLARENRMLQDRLSDGNFRSRARQRDRWILAELRSESRSPTRRGPPRASGAPAATARRPAPSEDVRTRHADNGRRQRRSRLAEASPDSSSGSEPLARARSRSPSPNSDPGEEREGGARGRRPPRNRPRTERAGEAPVMTWDGTGRKLPTRSADDKSDDPVVLRGSTLSGGSAHSSTMGARYERLQAMYRRVNRRDTGTRGRAGVG